MTKDRNDIELKPFTETLELAPGFVIKPDPLDETFLFIEQECESAMFAPEEARALYEYLNRHFEQSDRERLRRFQQLCAHYKFPVYPEGDPRRGMPAIDVMIDEFLKSEEGK